MKPRSRCIEGRGETVRGRPVCQRRRVRSRADLLRETFTRLVGDERQAVFAREAHGRGEQVQTEDQPAPRVAASTGPKGCGFGGVTCPVARKRVMSSNVPANQNPPSPLEVVDVPACGPSRTSTLAPSRGLNVVSYTMPLMKSSPLGGGAWDRAVVAVAVGVLAVGPAGPPSRLPSPQPAIPWASNRSAIPTEPRRGDGASQ